MTKREKIKQLIAPIVKEILIECLSSSSISSAIDQKEEKRQKSPAIASEARNKILNEHKKALSGDFSSIEGKFRVSEGMHKLSQEKKSSSLAESILSKLDPEDYIDNGEAAEDYEADAVISEMSSTWKQMLGK